MGGTTRKERRTEMNLQRKALLEMALVSRQAANIRRFNTAYMISTDTVGQHSWGVCVLCDIICGEHGATSQLLRAAMYHDMAEIDTGDVPATAKWADKKFAAAIEDRENVVAKHFARFNIWPELTEQEQLILKWADSMDGMLFCLKEHHLGNRYAGSIFNKWMAFLAGIRCPTVEAQQLYFAICEAYKENSNEWCQHIWDKILGR